MKILGLNNFANHDPSAAVVVERDGKLDFIAIAEERLSRVKRSHYSPLRSIAYCMDAFGIKSLREFDLVVLDYIFHKQLQGTALHYRYLEHDYIKQILDLDFSKVAYIESHHLAHAYTAFYPSGFDAAAVLVVDGFGSNLETNSLYDADGTGIRLLDKAYGQGIGSVYEDVTDEILGFRRGQEGKTMGLAAYGEKLGGDPILKFNAVFDGIVTDYSEFLSRPPREFLKQKVPRCPRKEDVTSPFYAKVAFEVQEEAERCLIHLANHAYQRTGRTKLCIAGGVGLNCVANSKILERTPIKELFVQPAASDVGLSFGAALFGYHQVRKAPRCSFSVYTGRSYPKGETAALLDEHGIPHVEASLDRMAGEIAGGRIIGWFTRGSEFGPRALGHRSILADPRNPDMKDILNAKVKHREHFRPFAPSILEEHVPEYFELDGKSPYMLLAPRTRKEKLGVIPAAVHVDGLARVQSVPREEGDFYGLIQAFHRITGVPVLLNTSFNDNNEPLVESPLDALLCFLKTQIDLLYLDGILVGKDGLQDLPGKIRRLEALRNRRLDEEYRRCVRILCKGYDPAERNAFLRFHRATSLYYSTAHTFVKLKGEIHGLAGRYRRFVTDAYHEAIIREHMREEHQSLKDKLVVMDDCLRGLDRVGPDSFVVLFNLSLYVTDPSCHNFYRDFSLLRLQPPYQAGTAASRDDDFDGSVEFARGQDWDGFYDKVVFRAAPGTDASLSGR